MRIRCPHCGLDLQVPPDSEGKTLRCPGCRESFDCRLPKAIVVEGEEAPPSSPPPPPQEQELLLEDEVAPPEESPPDPVPSRPPPQPSPGLKADEALSELGRAQPRRIVKESSRQWYVLVGGVAAVALTYEQLKAKAAAGEIKPKTKIFYAPKDVTLPARDLPGLFGEEGADRDKPRRRRRLSEDAAAAVADAAEALSRLDDARGPAASDGEEPRENQ
jgi:hypothetical protein